MRRVAPSPALSAGQQAAASRGLKPMIPIGSRPFLDYVLESLADAGLRQVCLVIGPGGSEIREHYTRTARPPAPLSLEFAVQAQPLGTAHAVLAAESFAAGDSFLSVNADNLYPGSALQALRRLPRAGLAGWRRSTLLSRSNFSAERIGAFALIEVNTAGELARIVEKPGPVDAEAFGPDPMVSMNAWVLPPTIFEACRAIEPSTRGELELPQAVRHAIERLDERFRVVESNEGVLDLSHPGDIPAVEARIRAGKLPT